MCPRGRDLTDSSMYGDLERVKLCLSKGSNFSRFVNNFCHLVLWKYMERKRAEALSKLLMPGEIVNPGSVTPLFYRKQETQQSHVLGSLRDQPSAEFCTHLPSYPCTPQEPAVITSVAPDLPG